MEEDQEQQNRRPGVACLGSVEKGQRNSDEVESRRWEMCGSPWRRHTGQIMSVQHLGDTTRGRSWNRLLANRTNPGPVDSPNEGEALAVVLLERSLRHPSTPNTTCYA